MERNVLKERLMNKDDKNRHFVLLIIDISKHGAKEMVHVKMAGPGFVNDVTARCSNMNQSLYFLWNNIEIMAFVTTMSTR
jgi:hypothetical protein